MTERSAYRTRARTELLDLLKNAPGKHFSAAEVMDHFIAENKPIGIFTFMDAELLLDQSQEIQP